MNNYGPALRKKLFNGLCCESCGANLVSQLAGFLAVTCEKCCIFRCQSCVAPEPTEDVCNCGSPMNAYHVVLALLCLLHCPSEELRLIEIPFRSSTVCHECGNNGELFRYSFQRILCQNCAGSSSNNGSYWPISRPLEELFLNLMREFWRITKAPSPAPKNVDRTPFAIVVTCPKCLKKPCEYVDGNFDCDVCDTTSLPPCGCLMTFLWTMRQIPRNQLKFLTYSKWMDSFCCTECRDQYQELYMKCFSVKNDRDSNSLTQIHTFFNKSTERSARPTAVRCEHDFTGNTRRAYESGLTGNTRMAYEPGFTGNTRMAYEHEFTGNTRRAYEPGFTRNTRRAYEPGFTGNTRSAYEPGFTGNTRRAYEPGFTGNTRRAYEPGSTGNTGRAYEPGLTGNTRRAYEPGFTGNTRRAYEPGFTGDTRSAYEPGFTGNTRRAYEPGFTGNTRRTNLPAGTDTTDPTNYKNISTVNLGYKVQAPEVITCKCGRADDLKDMFNCQTCSEYGICGAGVVRNHKGHDIEDTLDSTIMAIVSKYSEKSLKKVMGWAEDYRQVDRESEEAFRKLCGLMGSNLKKAATCGDVEQCAEILSKCDISKVELHIKVLLHTKEKTIHEIEEFCAQLDNEETL